MPVKSSSINRKSRSERSLRLRSSPSARPKSVSSSSVRAGVCKRDRTNCISLVDAARSGNRLEEPLPEAALNSGVPAAAISLFTRPRLVPVDLQSDPFPIDLLIT